MRKIKTLVAACFLLAASSLFAQNSLYVFGQMTNTFGGIIPVTLETFNVTPPVTSTVYTDANGNFADTLNLSASQGGLLVTFQACDSTIVVDSLFFSPSPLGLVVTLLLDYCPNSFVDCLGVPGGTALPGTPCNDNDSTTFNDMWDPNCVCAGTSLLVDCLGIPGGTALPGTPCNDNDSTTVNDMWSAACVCMGSNALADCLGVIGGPDVPGAPCDDGDSTTVGDTWDQNCNCVGNPVGNPCAITFFVWQPWDSLTNQPILNTLNVWVNTTAIGGQFQYFWDFGDNTTSNSQYPTHTYAGNGPYLLCVTVSGMGCTSTYCDTVAIDTNGVIVPGQSGNAGFTINMLPNGSNSVVEIPAELDELTIAPNPISDAININFSSLSNGNGTVMIFDMSGKQVLAENLTVTSGNNRARIGADGLEKGSYLIRIEANGGVLNKRFVKVMR